MVEGDHFAVASMVGGREVQQDDWGAHSDPPSLEGDARLLATLADGMGGMPHGEDASAVAVRGFLDAYSALGEPASKRLRGALAAANRSVGAVVDARPEFEGMGTTLVAGLFFDDRVEWLSVGDSLVLHYRQGRLRRINPLHIYARDLDEMARRGEITESEARNHPYRVALTSAVQGGEILDVSQDCLPLLPGDVVLLASDGIATLTEADLTAICSEHASGPMAHIADTIISQIDSRQRRSQDNATVIAVRCSPNASSDLGAPDDSPTELEVGGAPRPA